MINTLVSLIFTFDRHCQSEHFLRLSLCPSVGLTCSRRSPSLLAARAAVSRQRPAPGGRGDRLVRPDLESPDRHTRPAGQSAAVTAHSAVIWSYQRSAQPGTGHVGGQHIF